MNADEVATATSTGAMVPMLRLRQVRRHYAGTALPALDDVDLDVADGEFLAIVGASGSGKSTLLNIVGLLDGPDAGDYLVDGVPVAVASEKARTLMRSHLLGFVFQSFHLLPYKSAHENVVLGMAYRANITARDRAERAADALARVGLADKAARLPGELSGGERQRVAIARALARRPRLLLCDEPTGNLDSHSADVVMGLLEETWTSGMAVVLVTHDRGLASCCPRQVTMSDGRIVEDQLRGSKVPR